MNEDLLERAAEVVRERYDGDSELAAKSEQRVLAAFNGRKRRTRRTPVLAIPLVAALLASAAWGLGSAKLRALVHLGSATSPASAAVSPKATPRTTAAQPPAPPLELPSAPSPEPLAPPTTPAFPETRVPVRALVPSRHPLQRAPSVVESSAPVPAATASAPSDAEISALFRSAHRAQFSGGDPSQTLLLWDRYLSVAPNGALSPEARYNRAITLARLGRTAEAAVALEPFARGDYGGYRKNEASTLLQVLRAAPAP